MASSEHLHDVGTIIINNGEIPQVEYDLRVQVPSSYGGFVAPGNGTIRIPNMDPMHAANLASVHMTYILRLADGRHVPFSIRSYNMSDNDFSVELAGAIVPGDAAT